MLNNLSDTEQEEAQLRYLFGEALSEYLQGYAYEQGPPAFDTLETASLNLGNDVPRQGFAHGGSPLSLSDAVANVADNPVGVATTAASAVATAIAGGSPVIGIAANALSLALTGHTITENLLGPITNPFGLTGLIGRLDIEIENPSTGQITTLSGRQAIADSEGKGRTDDLSFAPTQQGMLGIGQNMANIAITSQQAPMTVSQIAEASDPAADAAAAAVTAGQGVAPGGSSPSGEVDSPESGAGIGASQGSTAGQTGTGATGMAAESGFGDSGTGVGSGSSSSGDTGNDSGHADSGQGMRQSGGIVKGYRHGDLVDDDQADTQLDDLGLGPIGVVNDSDGTTGVADDLDMDLPDKSYVLNAEAVRLAGIGPINTMIKKAIDLAIEDGVDLPNEIKTAEKVPIRISKGEAVLPHPLDMYIGTGRLEKMNNRGLRVREQRESEEAPVQMAAAPSPQEDLLAQIQPVA